MIIGGDAMNDDDDMVIFCEHDGSDFLSRDEAPLIIRENGDFELRFYFNPARFKVEKNDIKPLSWKGKDRRSFAGESTDSLPSVRGPCLVEKSAG